VHRYREVCQSPRAVRDPVHVRRHLAREPGDPRFAQAAIALDATGSLRRTPMTNGPGKSDRPTVPEKSPNKAGQPVAEGMEGKGLAKGNLPQQNVSRTPSRTDTPSALERVRQAAGRIRSCGSRRFCTTSTTWKHCGWPTSIEEGSRSGVDGETWRHYGETLEGNLQDLAEG